MIFEWVYKQGLSFEVHIVQEFFADVMITLAILCNI